MTTSIDRASLSFSSLHGGPPRRSTRGVQPVTATPSMDRFAFYFMGLPPVEKERPPVQAMPERHTTGRLLDFFI